MVALTQKVPLGGTVGKSNYLDKVVDDLNALYKVAIDGFKKTAQADGTTLANVNIGTSYVNIPGVSIPVTLTGLNAYVIAHQSVDLSPTSSTSGQLFVIRTAWNAGASQDSAGQIVCGDKAGRVTPSRSHKIPLSAGTYTFIQQVTKTGTAITGDVLSSTLLIEVFDIP